MPAKRFSSGRSAFFIPFTQITTTTPQAQRIAVGGTATVRRYVRASTVTSGGFTSCTFAVAVVKNQLAVNF